MHLELRWGTTRYFPKFALVRASVDQFGLDSNGIGDAGATGIGKALLVTKSLETLDLSICLREITISE